MEEEKSVLAEEVVQLFEGRVVKEREVLIGQKEERAGQQALFHAEFIPTPAKICEQLSRTVLGQEEAKKSLSVILYQHLKRCSLSREGEQIPKTNALLIGPSGSGKTMLARALAGVAGLTFLKVDATNFTQRGYRGGMHSEMLIDLLRTAAKRSRQKASRAVVFIDEVDKLARDRWGEDVLATSGVQQDLLSIIDGGAVFYERDHDEYAQESFDFSNVLFLFGGTFSRLSEKRVISPKDLARYGFMPEFANRLGNIIRLEPLGEEELKELVRREVGNYRHYLPITESELNTYTELILTMIMLGKEHEDMGGRSVGPAVRRFFEERIFNCNGEQGH